MWTNAVNSRGYVVKGDVQTLLEALIASVLKDSNTTFLLENALVRWSLISIDRSVSPLYSICIILVIPLTPTVHIRNYFPRWKLILTRHTLISVYMFSILFIICFLRCWKREFVYQSRSSLVSDDFLCSRDFYAWFRGDIGRKIRYWSLSVV